MRLKKHYLCTALSLAFTQQAVAAQESDSLTGWSSPVSSTTTTVLDQPQNSGTVDYSGLDAGIKGKISNILDVGLSYALIHADAKRKDIGKITDLPTQTMTAWMTLKPWEPLSVTLSEEARSSSYSNSDGSQKAAGFAVTHIRADYTLGHGFSVNASVNNLFDTQYAYSEGFIEEGRNFWAGVEYTF
ncbi:TonB-dependent receptor [Escherichia coli]|nr:TonB-dependent receptor [Escherichia coli]